MHRSSTSTATVRARRRARDAMASIAGSALLALGCAGAALAQGSAPPARMALATAWEDKVVGSEVVADPAHVLEHRLVFTTVGIKTGGSPQLDIAAREELRAAAARADVIERTTVRAADGGNAVRAVLGAINIVNPMAWLLNDSMQGVSIVTATQQQITPQKTRMTMRFLGNAVPLPDRVPRDFSGPASNRAVRVTAETPDFVIELAYTLDDDGKLSIPIAELLSELARYGYVPGPSALALSVDAVGLPASTARIDVDPPVIQALAR